MAWEKSEMIGVMDKLFIITPHSNHSKYLEQFWVSFNLPKMLCFHGGHIYEMKHNLQSLYDDIIVFPVSVYIIIILTLLL